MNSIAIDDPTAAPKTPSQLFEAYRFRARKRFGQHFLTDPSILDEIVTIADIRSADPVIEIGPGCGTLTLTLVQRGAVVHAVEIDRDAVAFLRQQLEPHYPVTVQEASALDLDWGQVLQSSAVPWKVVANLPYNISTKLLFLLFEQADQIEEMTLMFQREVADRIVARAGEADFGALSLMSRLYADAHLAMTLPPQAFVPPPKVHSAVVQFRLIPGTRIVDKELRELFCRLVDGAFKARRKTLANGLKALGIDKAEVERALEELDLNPRIRAEKLSFDEFVRLSEKLQTASGD